MTFAYWPKRHTSFELAHLTHTLARRAGHFLGLVFEGGVPEGTAQRFAEQKIFVSVRGNSVRVTPHLYNDEEDIERFLGALRSL